MNISGLEINSPEYWEIRHRREPWPRTSGWVQGLLAEIIPHNASILEIGCGQGAFAAALKKSRPDVIVKAVDVSPTAIEKAQQSYGLTQSLTFEVADIFQFSKQLVGEAYDYVISIQNFEHWPKEHQKEAFHQCWKRVSTGGKFFFTGVGMDWDLEQMNYSPMEYNGQILQVPNDYHYNKWSEQNFYDLCQTQKAKSVKFWRLRGKDRVVAEAEKG